MGKFINPFTDVGFKKIFGQEVSKDLLIDFLNDLLVGERSIKDITFLDKELLPEYMGDRGVIYDIYCTTESGEHIIVEMQNRQQTNFKERALFYLSHTITRQGEKGARWEFDLKAVYGVFFMNFRLEDTPHKLRTDIVLSDRDTHEVFSDKLRFIFIELPSFNKEEEECETDFERWIYILKNMETLNRLPFKARKAVFEKLEKIVDIASLSKEERIKYDESIKVYRDNLATISFAENKGLKRGREEGLKEGIEKGLKKGRKEGILSVARNLRSGGMSVEAIAAATGLSIEEIEQLDVADVVNTFRTITEIIDASVNEKIREISELLNGSQQTEDQGSAFDDYDRENGYIEEQSQEEVWESYRNALDNILQICIRNMRNSYKDCLESDLSDLLDYVVFQVEYDREK